MVFALTLRYQALFETLISTTDCFKINYLAELVIQRNTWGFIVLIARFLARLEVVFHYFYLAWVLFVRTKVLDASRSVS